MKQKQIAYGTKQTLTKKQIYCLTDLKTFKCVLYLTFDSKTLSDRFVYVGQTLCESRVSFQLIVNINVI